MIERVVRSGAVAGVSATRLLFPGRDRYDTVLIELDGEILEDSSAPGFMRYVMPKRTVLRDLLFTLEDIATDDRVWGVVFLLRNPQIGWAQAQELRDAIGALGEQGIYTLAFCESAGNLLYYLACACDEVILAPPGELALRGLASEVTFFADALDKVHVEPDFEHIGIYKSAAEHFMRRSMSKPHREEVTALLDGLTDQLVTGIAASRGLPPRAVKACIDTGGFLAEEAKRAGLVDELLYQDELDDYLTEKKGDTPHIISWGQYGAVRHIQRGPLAVWKHAPTFALLYATGPLTMGESTGGAMGRDTAGARSLVEGLRFAREDKHIQAIIMRVDSPGGGVLASDLIWREVDRAREQKPTVISFGDTAASGGYYIAAPGHAIFASPGTLTGSIGIIAGKVNLKGLYDAVGIKKEVISRGKMARFDSEYGRFTAGERKLLRHHMEETYRTFLERVATGRSMTKTAVTKVAEGRVWLGNQAAQRGLVDKVGGLLSAIQDAKERADIPGDVRPHFAIYPRRRKFLGGVAGWLPLGVRTARNPGLLAGALRGLPDGVGRDIGRFLDLAHLTQTERILALMTYGLKVE